MTVRAPSVRILIAFAALSTLIRADSSAADDGRLAVTAIKAQPETLTSQEYVLFTVTLTNIGTQTVDQKQIYATWITVYCPGSQPCPRNKQSFRIGEPGYAPTVPHPSLLPGESMSIKFYVGLFNPGNYEVYIGASTYRFQIEPNSGKTISLTVTGPKLRGNESLKSAPKLVLPQPASGERRGDSVGCAAAPLRVSPQGTRSAGTGIAHARTLATPTPTPKTRERS